MKIELPQPPRRGEWASLTFAKALSAGDVEAATACLVRDACFVTRDATAIHGRDHIRPVLAQLVARRTQIEVAFSNVIVTGDVALARERWTIHANGVEGSRFEQTSSPTLALRQIEDQWRLAIVAPWGWGDGFEL